jgi:hypothetical protein
MTTNDQAHGLLYFENLAVRTTISGLTPESRYQWRWFNPRTGSWSMGPMVETDAAGSVQSPAFPGKHDTASVDWAARVERL